MEYEEDSSNDSSSESGEQLEVAQLLGEQIEIPQGLAENPDIFREFFNVSAWQSLNPSDQAHLMKFLPTFPENDAYEKNITLRRLLNRDNFKFGSPLTEFHDKLQNGYFRPDIAHLRHLMKKAERRQYKEQRKRHTFSALKDVIVGRREILETAYNTSPGPLKLPKNYSTVTTANDAVQQRVKKRYFQELAAVRSEVGEYSQSSEDENYVDRPARTLSKKQRYKLSQIEASLAESNMKPVTFTLATKPTGFDLESHITATHNPFEITDEMFRKMLSSHRKKRLSQSMKQQKRSNSTSVKDKSSRSHFSPKAFKSSAASSASASPVDRTKRKFLTASSSSPRIKTEQPSSDFEQKLVKKLKKELDNEISKKSEESTDEEIQRAMDRSEGEKNIDVESASPTNIPQNQKLIEKQALQQQQTSVEVPAHQLFAPDQIKVEGEVKESVKTEETEHKFRHTELMQDTHVSFFSLLRDIICSSPQHRMRLDKMEARLRAWETNPISPLNEWFSLVDESWSSLLDSALSFLAGDYPSELQPDDFVPYIEYKAIIRSYQWIGAGRDSDSHLLALCSYWLDHKEELIQVLPPGDHDMDDLDLDDIEDEPEPVEEDAVPPPRCPTTWTVRPSSEEEKAAFQEQERERFQNPTKAFTYRMHGYESVVGPVKGIYNSQTTSSVLKPRGHNLLAQNRPSYVTVLALVRDAAARLPNGEGTRTDMCTLIRDSQYLDLSQAAESTLQSVVSGALDRLHYEVDACVRFDTKRKSWVYLHRRRSEAEMEKMHQQYQGVSKTIKKPARKRPSKKTDPATPGQAGKDTAEKPARKSKAKAKGGKDGETTESTYEIEAEGVAKFVHTTETNEVAAPPKAEVRQNAPQEIITSSGKKILIQSSVTGGRNPVSFVTSTAKAPQARRSILLQQPTSGSEQQPTTLLKSNTSGGALTTSTGSPFIVKNLAGGTQFLTASGQKVQIIASAPQNIGQIQSIQLSNGQNLITQNLHSASSGTGNQASAANLLQNIQQVQILTSSGQIITRTIPANATSTIANLATRTVTTHQAADDGKTSVLKTTMANSTRTTLSGIQMALAKSAAASGKPIKGVNMVQTTNADAKSTMSLLTSNQVRVSTEEGKPKLTGLQMVQKMGGKLGTQLINVSGVQLLNKPLLAKNNASVLTGVKLVSTQQGVKMVATSATTVVQTAIPTQKATSTIAKPMQGSNQAVGSGGVAKVQRTGTQIVNMDALVQGARANAAGKGSASLIQIPSTSGGLPQFAVVSQGNLLSMSGQPRIIQTQHLSNITSATQTQRTLVSSPGVGQTKQPTGQVRMAGNVTLAGIKPVILAKTQQQSQNVILASDSSGTGQALVLSPQSGVRANTPGTVTVMQQGGQQILLPTTFPAGTINLKSLQGLQGLKVIPISSGGQKVYARFVKNTTPQQTQQQQQQSDASKTDESK